MIALYLLCVHKLLIKNMKKVKSKNKDYICKVRMNDEDYKKLEKISKILKVTNSETVRTLIDNKIQELNKQQNIFNK